jgi:hypothetical protein
VGAFQTNGIFTHLWEVSSIFYNGFCDIYMLKFTERVVYKRNLSVRKQDKKELNGILDQAEIIKQDK